MKILIPFTEFEVLVRHPERLLLLLLLPLLFFGVWAVSRSRRKELAKLRFSVRVSTSSLPSTLRRVVWWSGVGVVITILTISLTVVERLIVEQDPVYGHMRITFIVDCSPSAFFADEVPNRMEFEKDVMRGMINMLRYDSALKGRYSLAVIPFAGSVNYLFAPFTISHDEILSAIDEINLETITTAGTSLLAALHGYEALLWGYPPPEDERVTEISFLLSDGGKEEGQGGEKVRLASALRWLHEGASINGGSLILNTIGIGKFEERVIDGKIVRVPVPAKLVERDKGGEVIRMLRIEENRSDSPVLVSELDEEVLKYLAKVGEGSYIHASDKQKVLDLFRTTILKYRKKVNEIPRARYEPISSWIAAPVLGLLFFLFGCANWLARLLRICTRFGK